MQRKNTNLKYVIASAVFALICAVFVARLINLQFDGERTAALRESSDITVETQVIQALRGDICDRNGNILVTSSYSYDVLLDYNSMPDGKEDFCRVILAALDAVKSTDNGAHRAADYYPLVGEYPSLALSEDARTEGTSTKRFFESVLTRANVKEKTADALVGYIVDKYSLDAKDKEGEPLFTNAEIDALIRVLYDMLRVQFSSMQPYTLAIGVDIEFISYLKELSIKGISDKISTKRTYLYPGYASHILGRVGAITAENWEEYREAGYDINATVGIDGCEYAFEEYLRGVDGILTIERNARGEIVDQYVSKQPIAGRDVWLTIDIDTQIAAEDELAAYMKDEGKNRGASVAIDPSNGDILALASYPTYDLTTFSRDYSSLASNEHAPLLNRAIYATYAPGSTFKIAVALAGLEEGLINKHSTCYCNGGYILGSGKISCQNHVGTTTLDLIDAITYSCNAYFISLGYEQIGNATMVRYCEQLGLGQSTGIELDEKIGQIASPDAAGVWSAYEEASSYIGQSVHKYTPLQINSYMATVANGGVRYATHLLHSVRSFSGEVIYSQEAEVLSSVDISSASLSAIKEGMREMVDHSGSASYYMYTVEGIDATVCGKSGTAQIGGDRQNCWFSAFAPMEQPKIVVTSIVEDGSTGASVSRIDAAVIGAYLNK